MDKEYPLYPELKQAGAEEAQALMDRFKVKMEELCKEILSKIYTDVTIYIESDSWSNFRNELMAGLSKYGNRKLQGDYEFDEIRKTIFEENREEIIKECQQDIIEENEKLKKRVSELLKCFHNKH